MLKGTGILHVLLVLPVKYSLLHIHAKRAFYNIAELNYYVNY